MMADIVGGSSSSRVETVVELVGEIDIATCDESWEILRTALDRRGDVIVDLAQVTFMGSTGLSLLLRARADAGESRSVRVRNPSPVVLRLLQLTGLAELLLLDVTLIDLTHEASPV